MKGYWKENGYPIHLPWLTELEPHIIVSRYNAVISGLVNFYANFISSIGEMSKWIDILIKIPCE
jgi:hypothetical protein